MPDAPHRAEHPPVRNAEPRDRALAVRRVRHIKRLLEQDRDELLRAMQVAAALRSFASACVELGESFRVGHHTEAWGRP